MDNAFSHEQRDISRLLQTHLFHDQRFRDTEKLVNTKYLLRYQQIVQQHVAEHVSTTATANPVRMHTAVPVDRAPAVISGLGPITHNATVSTLLAFVLTMLYCVLDSQM